MTARGRAERLIGLYRLRAQVAEEIATVEAEIVHEAAAIGRARDRANRTELCGTDSGYHHHRRVKHEQACAPCKLAHSASCGRSACEGRRRFREAEAAAS